MAGIGPQGATALVTGAGSGIGAATAREYDERGARVVCVDIDGDAAARVAATCGHGARGYTCDVSVWEAVRVVHACHAFGPGMIERRRGQVVNVASAGGLAPSRRVPIYGTTKAAVIYLSRALRADWTGDGVGVSVICPGVVDTPIFETTRAHGMSERELSFIRGTFARGHAPGLVARAIVDAAARNRAQVAVGWDAQVLHHLLRVTPSPFHGLLARR